MFRSRDYARRAFEDQFEPEREGFLYRRSMRGAPVRVSAAEREAFVADFARSYRRLSPALFSSILLLAVARAAVSVATGRDVPDRLFYAGAAALVALWVLLWRRTQHAPARALERRAPVGGERSRAEMRRILTERMDWKTIVGLAFAIPVFGWMGAEDHNGSPAYWVWIAGIPVSLAGLALIAWRKWQAGSSG